MSGKHMSWEKRIETARKRGYFTAADLRDAGDWNSCAIGERSQQAHVHPWHIIDASDRIHRSGVAFYTRVKRNQFDLALATWNSIGKQWDRAVRRLARLKASGEKFYP